MPSATPVLPGTQTPTTPSEAPYINPDEVRRPKEHCDEQKRRGGYEIC